MLNDYYLYREVKNVCYKISDFLNSDTAISIQGCYLKSIECLKK